MKVKSTLLNRQVNNPTLPPNYPLYINMIRTYKRTQTTTQQYTLATTSHISSNTALHFYPSHLFLPLTLFFMLTCTTLTCLYTRISSTNLQQWQPCCCSYRPEIHHPPNQRRNVATSHKYRLHFVTISCKRWRSNDNSTHRRRCMRSLNRH